MNGPLASRDKIGSSRSVLNVNEKFFPRGSLLFIEGESSREMFIIRSGKVRILKLEGEKTIELAVLGPGSVLGELALLDKQPRSATGQVVEELMATVIDEEQLEHTMATIPPWLANIIAVVVGRLRDTMRKASDTIVKKSVGGVIRVLLLLRKHEGVDLVGERVVPVKRAAEVIASTIGIGEVETDKVFLLLILKELLIIRRDENGLEYAAILDETAIELYMNWLRAAQRGAKFPGEELSDNAIAMLPVIIDAGTKSGRTVRPGVARVGVPAVDIEYQRRGLGKIVDPDAIEELLKAKTMFKEQAPGQQAADPYRLAKTDALLYSPANLERLMQLHVWIERFREDVKFG